MDVRRAALIGRFLAVALAVVTLGAGCAEDAPVPGERRIVQGTVATYGDTRLGFIGTDRDGRALVAQWSQGDEWSTRWRLSVDAVLPASGEFLRVLRIEEQQRDELVLVPTPGPPGVELPRPGQPLLPPDGRLTIGTSDVEIVEPPAADRVRIRTWPKERPLSDAPPEDVDERFLRVGDEPKVGGVALRVVRIDPFVVFDLKT